MPSYRGYRFPPDIISHAVWLYHRFSLSFRDVEDLVASGHYSGTGLWRRGEHAEQRVVQVRLGGAYKRTELLHRETVK